MLATVETQELLMKKNVDLIFNHAQTSQDDEFSNKLKETLIGYVKEILKDGDLPESREKSTFIARVIQNGDLRLVKLIIEAGANLDNHAIITGKQWITPLVYAAMTRNIELLQTLIAAGVKLDTHSISRYSDLGFTALAYACCQGDIAGVKVLLDARADPRIEVTYHDDLAAGKRDMWEVAGIFAFSIKALLSEAKHRFETGATGYPMTTLAPRSVNTAGVHQAAGIVNRLRKLL